jgi:hypothetical protein
MGRLRRAARPRRCRGGSGPDITRLRTRGSVRRAASRTAPAAGYRPTDSRGEAIVGCDPTSVAKRLRRDRAKIQAASERLFERPKFRPGADARHSYINYCG